MESVPIPISDSSDATLVRRAVDGSPEAFNILVRRWEQRIYSHLAHLTGRRDEAFDLCQEVFVSAYKHLGQLRDPERFAPWLFQIAHNTAYSHLRTTRDEEAQQADGGPSSPRSVMRMETGIVLERAEAKLLVEKALAMLSVEQREAIILKVYGGFRFLEIAEIQNCPVSTVKTRVYSGYEQLRKLIRM